MGLKSAGEKYMLESLWVKNHWGKNRGRWDAGFRSPFSGNHSRTPLAAKFEMLQDDPFYTLCLSAFDPDPIRK